MVLRMTGTRWLALMMMAERAGGDERPDSEWLLHGPSEEDDGEDILPAE
ncbi:MAG: hypothetical protein QM608_07185 [Caulobacter sp.]